MLFVPRSFLDHTRVVRLERARGQSQMEVKAFALGH